MLPNDPCKPFITSGLRIGTPAMTTRGLRENEARDVAHWVCDVLDNLKDPATVEKVRKQVMALCRQFPVYSV